MSSSWFGELAGKAENLLNKIDKNAASVLQVQQQTLNGQDQEGTESLTVYKGKIKNGKPIESANIISRYKSINSGNNDIPENESIITTITERPDEDAGKLNLSLAPNLSSGSSDVSSTADEISALKILLTSIKSERDSYQSELDLLLLDQKNDQRQEQIEQLQKLYELSQAERIQLIDLIESLKRDNRNDRESMKDMQITITKLHQSEVDLMEKLEYSKRETIEAVLELNSYRNRAQLTLQTKEKVIQQLTEGSRNDIDDPHDLDEMLKIRKRNTDLLSEVERLNHQINQSKLLDRRQIDLDHEKKHLLANKVKLQQLEHKFRDQSEELRQLQDELMQQKTASTIKIREKDLEINNLRASLKSLQSDSLLPGKEIKSQPAILENRLHSLTQSLVHKQNDLELMRAERNALRLQYEQLEKQYRLEMNELQRTNRSEQIINVNDTDDAKATLVPQFLQENPFDSGVSRRVKRAYSTLDSAGIRLGVFMRRYPLIRILVIFYMGILHLWVILVLFTSTPN